MISKNDLTRREESTDGAISGWDGIRWMELGLDLQGRMKYREPYGANKHHKRGA